MKKKSDIKAKLKALAERMKALSLQDTMTAAEQTEFDAADAAITAGLAEIGRLDAVENRSAAIDAISTVERTAVDVTGVLERIAQPIAPGLPGGSTIQRIEAKDLGLTGFQIAGICAWAAAANKQSPTRTSLQHLEDAGFQRVADFSRQTRFDEVKALMSQHGYDAVKALEAMGVQKTITSLSGGQGDNMITTPLMPDFVDFLRNQSIFLSGGPLEIDLSYGTLDIAAGNASAAATYGAEGADIGYSSATTRKISMAGKHLRVITSLSNILIRRSPLAVASIFGNDLVQALRLGMDSAGLRADGTGDNPAGILSLVAASHKFDVADENEPTIEEVEIEAKKALTKYRVANIPEIRPRWLMANRTFTYLQFKRDGLGNWAWPGLHNKANPTWVDGLPVGRSEQIPTNLGTGTDESELYLNDFGHTLVGIQRALQIDASSETTYINGSSAHISTFAREETAIRGVCSHDFDMRYDKAAVVMQKVKWGS